MVEANPTGGTYRPQDFVGKTQGKLRDHYRIGKILGTGKYTLLREWRQNESCIRMES